jgi:hypothetical protein
MGALSGLRLSCGSRSPEHFVDRDAGATAEGGEIEEELLALHLAVAERDHVDERACEAVGWARCPARVRPSSRARCPR